MSDPESKSTSSNLTRLYITALSAVAVLSIVGQLLIQHTLRNQMTDSRVINIAGKQRYKSQEICKLVLMYHFNYVHKYYRNDGRELMDLINTWEAEHYGLKNGNDSLELPGNNSDIVNQMFNRLDPYFRIIRDNAFDVASNYNSQKTISVENSVRAVMDNERIFLSKMDEIVRQYDIEAKEKVVTLRKIETFLLIITLTILAIEGLFIFRPAVKRLSLTVQNLIVAEKKASDLAVDLQLANKNLKEVHLREQRVKSAALIEGQEEERKSISMELHDGLVQTLATVKRHLESVQCHITENIKSQFDNIVSLVTDSIKEARRISFNLMPSELYDLGLTSALKHLARYASQQSGIDVVIISSSQIALESRRNEIHLYRIVQEALSNIAKYSQATKAEVSIQMNPDNVVVTIQDNGKGFNISSLKGDRSRLQSGNGIANMRERTNIINGKFNIESNEGHGTKITINLPSRFSEAQST